MDPSIVSQLVNTLGFGGVVVWLCWYMMTSMLPKAQQTAREEAVAAREDAKLQRLHYEGVGNNIVAEHRVAVTEMSSSVKDLSHSVSEMVKHCSAKIGREHVAT